VQDFFSANEREWVNVLDAGDAALFTRTTNVRQFSTGALDTPLDGGAPETGVHLKEISVAVQGGRQGGGLGAGKAITVRVLKAQ